MGKHSGEKSTTEGRKGSEKKRIKVEKLKPRRQDNGN